METRTILVLLAMVAVVSGCGGNNGVPEAPSGNGDGNKGLEISEFRAADSSLTPGQRTRLILTVENHNNKPVIIDSVSLLNTGDLEVLEKSCGDLEMRAAQEGVNSVTQCNWDVRAPSEETLGAFERKTLSFNLNLEYSSTLTNSNPLKMEFRPTDSIESVESRTLQYSNSDVSAVLETENPAPLSGRVLNVKVEETGPGSLENGFGFEYSPESLFGEDCPDSKRNLIDHSTEFSCMISADSETNRNLFMSIHYKYAKSPTLDIEVVKP